MPTRVFRILLVVLALASAGSGWFLAVRAVQGNAAKPRKTAHPAWSMRPFPGQASRTRDAMRYTAQLMKVVRGLTRLTMQDEHPLAPTQARDILAILTPLREQPTLDQEQAKAAMRALQRILTIEQRTIIAQQPNSPRPPAGNGPRRPPGSGPPPMATANPPAMDGAAMKDVNPFYPREDLPRFLNGNVILERLLPQLETLAAEGNGASSSAH